MMKFTSLLTVAAAEQIFTENPSALDDLNMEIQTCQSGFAIINVGTGLRLTVQQLADADAP